MPQNRQAVIFGEVLFDCFSSGEQILGGAPFNVAWHLNAFGDTPHFISRIGRDEHGQLILNAMNEWGMNTHYIQHDDQHPTGRVEVTVQDNEPQYNIIADSAYDFISPFDTASLPSQGLLYHGSLALRNEQTKHAFNVLAQDSFLPIFVDVNLRSPWWNQEDIETWLHRAQWAKLNEDELITLGFDDSDIKSAMIKLQTYFDLQQVIITRGEHGALICTKDHDFHHIQPPNVGQFVDTVGAGDAFTARYIHGLLLDEAIDDTIDAAQKFAIKVIGLRGATSSDPHFYD